MRIPAVHKLGSHCGSAHEIAAILKSMEITLNLPEDIAHGLEAKWKDLPRAALESLALEGYRSGALTAVQVRQLLGFRTRYELDGFLKQHGVYLNYTVEDVERDAETIRQFSDRR